MQTDTSIDTLKIGKYEFRSRLFVGTGKYPSLEIMQQAHEERGAEVVTVAIRLIKERANVPVIVDAGVGTASDAAIAMELGVDALLMNTGIAAARDPVRMARAMRLAVEAGRDAFLAGRMEKRLYANASSPMRDLIATKPGERA